MGSSIQRKYGVTEARLEHGNVEGTIIFREPIPRWQPRAMTPTAAVECAGGTSMETPAHSTVAVRVAAAGCLVGVGLQNDDLLHIPMFETYLSDAISLLDMRLPMHVSWASSDFSRHASAQSPCSASGLTLSLSPCTSLRSAARSRGHAAVFRWTPVLEPPRSDYHGRRQASRLTTCNGS